MKYITILITIILTGCVVALPLPTPTPTPTKPLSNWLAFADKDEFSDIWTCSVSVKDFYLNKKSYSINHYYPYIETVNGDLRVGIKSSGAYPLTVGDIQLRIDTNPAWEISVDETPLKYIPDNGAKNIQGYVKNIPEVSRKAFESTYKLAMESTARILSIYTAATGDKAQKILKEMLSGEKIKYRKVGLNYGSTKTNEQYLDNSLHDALRTCKIKL